MANSTKDAAGIARIGALLADTTRAEILCALMDGRAHTGSELARHVGVAPSTTSEHLSKLLDAAVVSVVPQGRHRYWRLANAEIAGLLEMLGAASTSPGEPRAPADLVHARSCYDHLAGELAVAIYHQLEADGHIVEDDGHLRISSSGFTLFAEIGMDVDVIAASKRPKAKSCLDWTQRRSHLAGAAGKELLVALTNNGWAKPGPKPRSMRITEDGRNVFPRRLDCRSTSGISACGCR